MTVPTDWLVEIVSTTFIEVRARDEDHAFAIAERRLPTEFGAGGGGRSVAIGEIEPSTETRDR